jgi:hypothetical protein
MGELDRAQALPRARSSPTKKAEPDPDRNYLTVRGPCAPGLVAGRYQPLADDVTIAGDVRPNPSSAVVQKTKRNGLLEVPLRFGF